MFGRLKDGHRAPTHHDRCSTAFLSAWHSSPSCSSGYGAVSKRRDAFKGSSRRQEPDRVRRRRQDAPPGRAEWRTGAAFAHDEEHLEPRTLPPGGTHLASCVSARQRNSVDGKKRTERFVLSAYIWKNTLTGWPKDKTRWRQLRAWCGMSACCRKQPDAQRPNVDTA